MSEAPLRLVVMGKMAAGKTQVSQYLAEHYGATTWTVAQRIKEVSHALVDQSGQLDPLLESLLPDVQLRHDAIIALLRFADGYDLEPGKPRRLYQEVGQILRDLHPETRLCWEAELERRIVQTKSPFTVIDIRSREGYGFFVGERGYSALRIDAAETTRRRRLLARDQFAVVDEAVFSHQSETDVDSLEFEFVINNNHDNLAQLNVDLDRLVHILRTR